MSHDGVMCWGSTPTCSVRITLKVFGSMTLTVPVSLFGTYTRVAMPCTAGASVRDVMFAYTFGGVLGGVGATVAGDEEAAAGVEDTRAIAVGDAVTPPVGVVPPPPHPVRSAPAERRTVANDVRVTGLVTGAPT